MVRASHRRYSDAVRWLKAARPRRVDSGRFAMRCFAGSILVGIVALGLIGLFAPAGFGAPGSRALGNRTLSLALGATVIVAAAVLAARGAHLLWLMRRIREPFTRPLNWEPNFAGAADALAQCSEAWKSRWAMSWVWAPALLAAAGATFAFSSAYFVVGAVIAGGRIAWGHPVLATFNAFLSSVCFAAGSIRLSTWRLALSVHREVTGRYLEL
jgi:hypothetical protein